MLYFNSSPNSHLSVVSITFVLHLFVPQLWTCYRLLKKADDFQSLTGFSPLSSAGGPVITAHVGSAAWGVGSGSSDIAVFIEWYPLLSRLEIQSCLQSVSNNCFFGHSSDMDDLSRHGSRMLCHWIENEPNTFYKKGMRHYFIITYGEKVCGLQQGRSGACFLHREWTAMKRYGLYSFSVNHLTLAMGLFLKAFLQRDCVDTSVHSMAPKLGCFGETWHQFQAKVRAD